MNGGCGTLVRTLIDNVTMLCHDVLNALLVVDLIVGLDVEKYL